MARTARRKPQQEHVEFVLRIGRPAAYYNFSLQRDRHDPDPYHESQHLNFGVWCLYPDRLKGLEGEANFFDDRRLTPGSAERLKPFEPPKAVGSVVVRKQRLEVGGHLPPDMIWRISSAMSVGLFTSMTAGGRWIKRSHAHLASISFHGPDFDPIDYIG